MFSLLISDIGKWIEFQTELEKRDLMLNLFKEGIAVINEYGEIHYCNDSFSIMTQKGKSGISGTNISNIVNTDLRSILSKEETIKKGGI